MSLPHARAVCVQCESFSWANLCFALKKEVRVVGGKLSSPFALNIKPLVSRFAQSKDGGERATRHTDTSRSSWCQVSDLKVVLRGCTARPDKGNPKVSWQP